jgi:ATPase subunit of ABC transporter with duplicated ATPase domains
MIHDPREPVAPGGEHGYLIEAHGLSVHFRDRAILDRVDLHVSRGEIVTVIGLNGAGKSTLSSFLIPHAYSSSREWAPSQKGCFFVCLHPHHATRLVSVISTSTGECSVPVWEPSQNG